MAKDRVLGPHAVIQEARAGQEPRTWLPGVTESEVRADGNDDFADSLGDHCWLGVNTDEAIPPLGGLAAQVAASEAERAALTAPGPEVDGAEDPEVAALAARRRALDRLKKDELQAIATGNGVSITKDDDTDKAGDEATKDTLVDRLAAAGLGG